MAGFLASKDQWLTFDIEWKNLLIEHEVPFLHMTEFENGAGCFFGWDKRKKQRFLDKALDIIIGNTERPITQAVLMDDYQAINDIYPFEEWFATPYALAGWLVYSTVEIWTHDRGDNEKVLMIFEDGSKHKGDFQQVAEREGFTRPSFVKKLDASPLQAADVLAWEVFRALNTGAFVRQRFRPSLSALLSRSIARHEMPFQLCNLNGMHRLCESQRVPRRSDINPKSTFVFQNSPKRNRRRTIFPKK